MLCWFLPYNDVNQPWVYMCLSLLPSSSPYPTPLGCHRVLGWAACVTQQLPTSYVFYIWWCICFHATLSVHPTVFFPCCVHKSVLYVCISIVALQTSSSVPYFRPVRTWLDHVLLLLCTKSLETSHSDIPSHSNFVEKNTTFFSLDCVLRKCL